MSDWALVVTAGPQVGTEFAVPSKEFFVGSDPTCEVCLSGERVAMRHARIAQRQDGQWAIEDVSGQGSLTIDGQPSMLGELSLGTAIGLGSVKLEVRLPGVKKAPSLNFDFDWKNQSSSEIPVGEPISLSVSKVVIAADPPPRPTSADTAVQPLLTPGELVAVRYRITDKIAAGGMGEVYRAEHVELGKVFALKMMRAEFSNDPTFVERFRREAIASARIGQLNIVDISDFGRTEDGRFFFVMEHLEGETLSALIHRAGAQSVERVAKIGMQMCDALAAAHHLGIVHRDLKPDNVMLLQRPGQPDLVKVLDFGIAKDMRHNAPGQTAVGMVVGTPEYMAPEQAMGMGADARSDLYSMGLILYELFTGRPPFTGASPGIVVSKHIREAPPPLIPGPIALPVPRALEEIIFRLLAKKPEQRPQTVAEVKMALAEAAAQAPTLPMILPSTRLSNPALKPVTPGPTLQQRGLAPPNASPAVAPETGMTGASMQAMTKRPWWALGVVGVLAVAGVVYAMREPTVAPVKDVPKPVVPVAVLPAAPVEAVVPDAAVAAVKPSLPAEVIAQVAMQVTAQPEKIEVYEGEKLLGQTPLTIRRDKGAQVELRFSQSGFVDQVKPVSFGVDGAIDIKLKKRVMEKKPAPAALKGLDGE